MRSPTLFSDSGPMWLWWYGQDLGEAWCGCCWVVLRPSLVTHMSSRYSPVGVDFLDVLLVDLGDKVVGRRKPSSEQAGPMMATSTLLPC
jgi:hypothetical protein